MVEVTSEMSLIICKKLLHNGKYIGVDGCKGGWIAAILSDGILNIKKFENIPELVAHNTDYNEFLIDMVVGLQSSKEEIRPDSAARALIPGKASTIFTMPSRQAVYADSREAIRSANKLALGKDLSAQTIAIIPKMRELDEFLQKNPVHKDRIKECHPEVCFSRINGSVIKSKKAEPQGLTDRINVVKKFFPDITEEFPYRLSKEYKCNADDILDAVILCITACLKSMGQTEVIPREIHKDVTGLTMQLTIPMTTASLL